MVQKNFTRVNPGGRDTVGLGPLLQKAPLELVEGEPFPKALLLLGPKLPEGSRSKGEEEVGGSDSAMFSLEAGSSGTCTHSWTDDGPLSLSRKTIKRDFPTQTFLPLSLRRRIWTASPSLMFVQFRHQTSRSGE